MTSIIFVFRSLHSLNDSARSVSSPLFGQVSSGLLQLLYSLHRRFLSASRCSAFFFFWTNFTLPPVVSNSTALAASGMKFVMSSMLFLPWRPQHAPTFPRSLFQGQMHHQLFSISTLSSMSSHIAVTTFFPRHLNVIRQDSAPSSFLPLCHLFPILLGPQCSQ